LKKLVIAIDGPAASGKSTTARLAAARLKYLFVDTGAMYRAVTLRALEQKVDPSDEERLGKLARETQVTFEVSNGDCSVKIGGRDVTQAIRGQAVTSAVSRISAIKGVREVMVAQQRRFASEGGVVIEGRDIGTVVLPDADLKIFLVAKADERAKRRRKELQESGIDVPAELLLKEIEERDRKDSSRELSPLKKADDAIELDTSRLTVEQQVDFVVEKVNRILDSRREGQHR
jgi:cytidylate kinase